MHPAMDQLSNLPVSERLTLVQDLWDSIAKAQEQLPAQDWHREIVDARLADFDGREEELGLSREQMIFDKEKLLSVFDQTAAPGGKDPVRTSGGRLSVASESPKQ